MNSFSVFQGRFMALTMALATILFFGLGGAAIITWIQGRSLDEVFTVHDSIVKQLLIGTAVGTLVGLIAKYIVSRPGMDDVSSRYAKLIGELHTTLPDRLLISLCAGVGEEIFFRGAIQYWFGIPLTAVFFVAIHGYLDPRNLKLFAYGMFMTLVMLAFGYAAAQYGLWGPVMAHMMIDVVLLEYLHRRSVRERSKPLNGHVPEDETPLV
jgi:membrane protease YdiL (CAAX protease family)